MSSGKLTTVNEMQPGRRHPLDEAKLREFEKDVTEESFWLHLRYAWPFTVCGLHALYNYYSAIRYVESQKIGGDIVECGVFLGGSAMFAAKYMNELNSTRPLRVFDSFYGFTENNPELDRNYDGKVVCNPNKPEYEFEDKAVANMRDAGYEYLEIVKGDIFTTLPRHTMTSIAVLRLDTDTYETTKFELEQLYDKVSPGGVVIIDDYGFNKGCALAVENFIADKNVFLCRFDRFGRSFVKPF